MCFGVLRVSLQLFGFLWAKGLTMYKLELPVYADVADGTTRLLDDLPIAGIDGDSGGDLERISHFFDTKFNVEGDV